MPPDTPGRLVVVSNRLPVTVRASNGAVTVTPSAGGLATAMTGPHERGDGLWIGWPGDLGELGAEERDAVRRQLLERRTVSVELTTAEVAGYYEGFANGVLWPLFHYLMETVRLDASEDWETYKGVNERFADVVAAEYRPGDLIWVHDYQLMLLPRLLRDRVPDARIGFFLHIPFPSTEVFRVLPWRKDILEGLLGADLVGFHTLAYQRHFAGSLLRILGLETKIDRLAYGGREVRLGVFPIGVDARAWSESADRPELAAEVATIRGEAPQKVLLGIDRLDYTKGIPRRLLAVERLLQREPHLRGQFRLVQLGVPTRENLGAYADFRKVVDGQVGRINSLYGTPNWVPIHYMHRALAQCEVVALYRAADVMLVTPLRDGMNLVAKEFVASRSDEDGVLVLSEFAGAASELGEALLVNPYDIDGVATAIATALEMPPEERRARMQSLRRRVFGYDVHRWTDTFLQALARPELPARARLLRPARELKLMDELGRAGRLCVLVDCDGKMGAFPRVPWQARPDPELRELLAALATLAGTEVHVISARPRDVLERWIGDLRLGLHAEHGYWSRLETDDGWVTLREVSSEWKDRVRPLLQSYCERTPGSSLDESTVGLVWHYGATDSEFGAVQAKELQIDLAALGISALEVRRGSMAVELRVRGIHKGLVVHRALGGLDAPPAILALADATTDDDLFAALPAEAVTVHVGTAGGGRARFRVDDGARARLLLRALYEAKR